MVYSDASSTWCQSPTWSFSLGAEENAFDDHERSRSVAFRGDLCDISTGGWRNKPQSWRVFLVAPHHAAVCFPCASVYEQINHHTADWSRCLIGGTRMLGCAVNPLNSGCCLVFTSLLFAALWRCHHVSQAEATDTFCLQDMFLDIICYHIWDCLTEQGRNLAVNGLLLGVRYWFWMDLEVLCTSKLFCGCLLSIGQIFLFNYRYDVRHVDLFGALHWYKSADVPRRLPLKHINFITDQLTLLYIEDKVHHRVWRVSPRSHFLLAYVFFPLD